MDITGHTFTDALARQDTARPRQYLIGLRESQVVGFPPRRTVVRILPGNRFADLGNVTLDEAETMIGLTFTATPVTVGFLYDGHWTWRYVYSSK